ncbi:BrnT family toxin [Cerasicoccus fimbriatus]|uniref:BrnT family toxin n=1 Tax=Cerasicoccus fimbriatus TaxID=3014554 RepID=UPI0022B3C793|nr:BrnT family toxin [Cerasicoccus sp. TK19100]
MKFDWNPEKNEWLKAERNISFDEIALLLSEGLLWRVMEHPNQERYPNQQIFLVPIDDYVYLIPFVMDGETIFLKTAIPSRKATRDYRKEMEDM